MRHRLAAPLAYSQRVEAMVTGLSIETLLPRTSSGDGYINRFLTVWTPDEQGHTLALHRLLVALDLEPFPLPPDEPVPIHNRVAGLLGTMSARMHETVELVYHSIGAMNERLAFSAYERMSEILTDLGEHGLVESLMKPLRRDESAHLGYYRTAARDLRDRLDRWQLAVARTMITRTYSPVGAGDAKDRPAFGATLGALGDSRDIVHRVQVLAESLLSIDERKLRPFVQRSFDRCSSSVVPRRSPAATSSELMRCGLRPRSPSAQDTAEPVLRGRGAPARASAPRTLRRTPDPHHHAAVDYRGEWVILRFSRWSWSKTARTKTA